MAPASRTAATCADVSVSGVVPNVFENRTRSCLPPTDTWTIWRKVLPARPGAGGMLLVSVGCGDEAHVPTQCCCPNTKAPQSSQNASIVFFKTSSYKNETLPNLFDSGAFCYSLF